MQPVESGPVGPKDGILDGTVLKAGEIRGQLAREAVRQPVYHPVSLPPAADQTPLAEIREMLGHLHLRFAQDTLEVADAEGARLEQRQQAKSRDVAQALVDPDKPHEGHSYAFTGI